MTAEPFVGVDEIAEYIGESAATVQLWARQGKIPGVKPGKAWKFRLSEVNTALTAPPADTWAQSNQSRGRRRKAS